MAIEAEARLVFKGVPEARNALKGFSRERSAAASNAKKAAQDETRANREAAKAQAAAEREKRRAAAQTTAAAKREAQQQAREADKLAKYWQDVARKSADERIRAEQRVTRAAQREAARQLQQNKQTLAAQAKQQEEHARRGRAFLGGLVGGAIGGAIGASNTARGIGGIRSMPERIQAANEFRERLAITGSQAHLSKDERAKVEGQINAAALSTGKDQGELLGVLEAGQAKFNDLRFFADNLKEIATIARASGTNTEDLAIALGYAKQAFGLTGDEAMEAAKLMVAGAAKGSIEMKDFATSFASVMGLFAENTGLKGLEGIRQLIGTAQAAGTLGKTPDATATLVERLIASLGESDVKTKLKSKAGIDVTGKTMGQIIKEMAESKKFADPKVREKVFGKGDILTNQAVTALIAAYRRVEKGVDGAIDIDSVAGVRKREGVFDKKTGKQIGWKDVVGATQGGITAAEGSAQTAQTMADLEGTGALAFDRKNAELQAHTLANLEDYNSQLLKVVDVSAKLEMKFDKLALWADAISGTGIGGAVGGMAAGGGGSLGGTIANGGMLMSIGKGLGKVGGPLAILAGGAAIASAVYESGAGEAAGNWFYDLLNDSPKKDGRPTGDVKMPTNLPSNVVPIRQPSEAATYGAQRQEASHAGEKLTKESEKQTKLLEQVVANTRQPPFREGPGTRGPR